MVHFLDWFMLEGRGYQLWSGFMGSVTTPLALAVFLRHRNCFTSGCWRLGHIDPKHGHPACRKHHSKSHLLSA